VGSANSTLSVSAERRIGATPEAIAAVYCDDSRFLELHPDAVDHRDIVPLPNGGHSCTQEYEVGGRRVVQRCTSIEYEPPYRFVDEAVREDSRGRTVLTLARNGTDTNAVLELTVTVLVPLSRLQRARMRKQVRSQIEAALKQLDSMVATPRP
jgi:hypothetical protein